MVMIRQRRAGLQRTGLQCTRLQCLFGWMNLVLAVPSIYLMFGLPLLMRQHGWQGVEIGLFQLAALPAVFKFLFAIPVQRVRFAKAHYLNWLMLLSVFLLGLFWMVGRDNLINEGARLFALTFAISVMATWADIPLNALAIQCLPRSEQFRAGNIRAAALFLGAILGAGVMIVVQFRFGWQAPFVLMGLGLLTGLAGLASVPSLRSSATATHHNLQSSHGSTVLQDWAGFFDQPGARQWTLVLLTGFPFIGTAWLYLKPLMLDQGIPMETVALVVGILGGLVGALSSLVSGRITRSMGIAPAIRTYLSICLCALGLLSLVVWADLGPVWLTISVIVVAVSMGAVSGLIFGLTMFFTRIQQNASDYGLQTTLFTMTRLSLPVAAGVLLDRWGWMAMLLSLTLGVLISVFLAWRYARVIGRSTLSVLEQEQPSGESFASIQFKDSRVQ